MSVEIGTFTPEQARLLWQDYQQRVQLKPGLQNNTRDRPPLPQATILRTGATIGAMDAATAALDGAVEFEFALLQKNSDGDLEDSGERLTGTNRDATLSALDGTLIYVAHIDGEWRPIWVACEAEDPLTGLT